jgi:putative membrane protein insertion efficiency factor
VTSQLPTRQHGIAVWTLLTMVRLYQACLSPILGRQCRFVPTCSNYFAEAVATYGAMRGGMMGLWRVLRCNPLCKGGYDPVPDYAGD